MKKIYLLFTLLVIVLTTGLISGCTNEELPSGSLVSSEPEISSMLVSSEPKPLPVLKEVIDEVYFDLLKGAEMDWLREPTEEELSEIFGLTEEMYQEVYILHTKIITHATRLVGVVAKDGQKQAVIEAVNSMKDEVAAVFSEEFLPEQHKITEDAILIENDNYIFLIMCENSEQARDIVDSYF